MKYIIYVRKSTEDEDRQILSIEAQLFELRQSAAKPACRQAGKNWKLSSARRSRDFGISRGAFLAAAGGENRPNYFKNRPPESDFLGDY